MEFILFLSHGLVCYGLLPHHFNLLLPRESIICWHSRYIIKSYRGYVGPSPAVFELVKTKHRRTRTGIDNDVVIRRPLQAVLLLYLPESSPTDAVQCFLNLYRLCNSILVLNLQTFFSLISKEWSKYLWISRSPRLLTNRYRQWNENCFCRRTPYRSKQQKSFKPFYSRRRSLI